MAAKHRMASSSVVLSLVVLAGLAAPLAEAETLPPGFEKTTLLTGNQYAGIHSFDWGPDGKIWIGEGTNQMRVWTYDTTQPASPPPMTRVLTLPGSLPGQGERGIHEIAVDPDFMANGHIWLYYSRLEDPVRNRLSRYTYSGGSLIDEQVMLEGPEVSATIHNGGCLTFASDGTLYLGMGDDGAGSATAQDPFDLRGKIIHLNRDGSPAAGNMYPDGIEGDARIWALGFRNPFRCNMQPGLDNLFVGDVGGASWEEIDLGVAGGNFGWATVEGPNPPGVPGMVYPIYAYDHSTGGAAVIAGDHVEPGEFHPDYAGDYFFGDYVRGEIYRMVLDESQNPVSVETWATGLGFVVDFEFGPDGALYYAARVTASTAIARIEYVGGDNRQPTAIATAIPDSGPAPLSVTLDGTGSFDPDEDPLTHEWDTGDGGSESGATANHLYPQGVYEAVLTVDDGNGLDDTSTPMRIVAGNERPSATIDSPTAGTKYDAGDTISFSGSGSDPEEGELGCSQFTWQVIFHHDKHTHPYLGPLSGVCSGVFDTATLGETSANTWYRITLTVADTGVPIGTDAALTGDTEIVVRPNTSSMTFQSLPHPDLQLTLDTTPFTAPMSVEGVVGFLRNIGVVQGQLYADGHRYSWLSWSDGGAQDHQITTPALTSVFIATFGCDVIVPVPAVQLDRDATSGMLTLSWDPLVDECSNTATPRFQIYAADSAVPLSPPGAFPNDPAFALVGETDATTFSYLPATTDSYFIVVGVGTDLLPGNSGHYGD